MAPKRLITDENREFSESTSASEPQPSTSRFMGNTPGEELPDIFMDSDLSSDNLPPSAHPFSLPLLRYPSPAVMYRYKL
ncbi:hypothetical protein E2C01_054163 [Portunus trituberculatus]|uniref:Uncharacterized protein n=1 Tax=Portunus trituberculatus TaxID=210409 RepID=A0A5B7GR76_PORTR|nr:hypothetical protein [Portunus trituberculatus]